MALGQSHLTSLCYSRSGVVLWGVVGYELPISVSVVELNELLADWGKGVFRQGIARG